MIHTVEHFLAVSTYHEGVFSISPHHIDLYTWKRIYALGAQAAISLLNKLVASRRADFSRELHSQRIRSFKNNIQKPHPGVKNA
jgi:hypothetical protein